MTPLEMAAGSVALLVLVLLLARPVTGIVALALVYPLILVAPRLPVPGMNVETTLVGVALALTLLRFGLRIPPPRYSLPVISLGSCNKISKSGFPVVTMVNCRQTKLTNCCSNVRRRVQSVTLP